MVFLIIAWLIAAVILLAVDVVGWLRRRGQQRRWLRSTTASATAGSTSRWLEPRLAGAHFATLPRNIE